MEHRRCFAPTVRPTLRRAEGHWTRALVRSFAAAVICSSLAWVSGCVAKAPNQGVGVLDQTCTADGGYNICPAGELDGGPTLGSCSPIAQDLEFFDLVNFESTTATYLYTYTDGTAGVLPTGYQPATVPGRHCSADDGATVFHLTGGPFLGWGGGMGVGMEHIAHGAGTTGTGTPCLGANAPSWCIQPGEVAALAQAAIDASQWDGVAVWARRGPNSQPLLRVLVGNKDTDDDISYLMARDQPNVTRYCERVSRDCGCNYHNLSCSFFPDHDPDGGVNPQIRPGGGDYCGIPGESPAPGVQTTGGTSYATNSCNATKCADDYPAYPGSADPQFNGRPCTAYQFRTGAQLSVCYDPARDPRPAEPDQQCGDHWTFPLHLTTEWQLFLVPFNQMYQQGFAKKAPFFDLKTVSVVRLTWDAGFIDYWVDNLRLYRVKRN
jgi:hypothetical protein